MSSSKELLYLFTVVLFYFKNEVDIIDIKQTVVKTDRSEDLVNMLLQARYMLQNIFRKILTSSMLIKIQRFLKDLDNLINKQL